jgi:hypothetical protein
MKLYAPFIIGPRLLPALYERMRGIREVRRTHRDAGRECRLIPAGSCAMVRGQSH